VFEAPHPPIALLAVFKSDNSVQLVPFQLSFTARSVAGPVSPPKPKADVDVPAAPISSLAVFKSLTSVQT